MGAIDAASLFLVMITLALIPGASVILVVTRSITHGISSGVSVSLGIVLGDLIFIALAISGLSVVAETLGWLFLTIKYMGAIYLIWFGYNLLVSSPIKTIINDKSKTNGSLTVSFFAGLFLTLGDIKAIFFYISLLPIFINPEKFNQVDVMVLVSVTIIAVGGAKIFYAVSAKKIVSMSKGYGLESKIKKVAGGFMVGAGSYLFVKT